MKNEHAIEAEHLFQNMMQEIVIQIHDFEHSLFYKQLTDSKQKASRQIISYFSEYMFDYHFKSMDEWDELSLQDVLVDIFPHEITAGLSFFENVSAVLIKFFDFLYYTHRLPQGKMLSERTEVLADMMLMEVTHVLNTTPEGRLIELGEELGIDVSSLEAVDQLYELAESVKLTIQSPTKIQIVK